MRERKRKLRVIPPDNHKYVGALLLAAFYSVFAGFYDIAKFFCAAALIRYINDLSNRWHRRRILHTFQKMGLARKDSDNWDSWEELEWDRVQPHNDDKKKDMEKRS